MLNPFLNKPWLLCVYSTSLLKTLKTEEIAVFSISQYFYQFEKFLPFSTNSKLLSANSFNLVGLVVFGFNATLTAKVISWQLVTHCVSWLSHNFSFQSHRLLSSHASAEVRDENKPERKVDSTRIKLTTTRS